MAVINDALIKRYQQWYKENNGRTLDKYTARAHLKRLMGGKSTGASSGGSGGVFPSGSGLQPAMYNQPVMWSRSEPTSAPSRTRSASSGGQSVSGGFLDSMKAEAKAKKEYDKAVRKRQEKLQDEARRNARADRKALQRRAIEIMKQWDDFEGNPPVGYGDALSSEAAMREAYNRAKQEQELLKDISGGTETPEVRPAKREPPTSEDRGGGGSITVTGDKVGGGDAKKGTIALQAGPEKEYKQVIFEPVDPMPKNGPYRGRYQVRTPIEGKNKFKDGKIITAGELYQRTNGEFGTEDYDKNDDLERFGPDNPPDLSDDSERFGPETPPDLDPGPRVEKFGFTTTTPESEYIPPVDYAEQMWGMLPREERARGEEGLKRIEQARRDRVDDRIGNALGSAWNWLGDKLSPTASPRDVYENIPNMENRSPMQPPVRAEIREEPGSVPMDKEGFFSRPSQIPYGGIQALDDTPAVSGIGEALMPRGNAWDDAGTVTGMNREDAQLELAERLGRPATQDEVEEYINWMTEDGLGTSLEWGGLMR
jgi:hypothetical protein